MNLKDTYTINEVAEMTGLTTRTIRNYLNDGHVSGKKVDGKWLFTVEDFAAMLANPYVEQAIKAKKNAPVLDFLSIDKKNRNAMCLIVDRCVSNEEAMCLSEKLCRLLEECSGVDFKLEKKEKNLRIILTGQEEQVKRIYLEMDQA